MKLIIIGNSGSGKTWRATRLAATTKTSVVHLDEMFWEPGGFNHKRSSEELDRLITGTKHGTSWIVEGVFGELTEKYLMKLSFLSGLMSIGKSVKRAFSLVD